MSPAHVVVVGVTVAANAVIAVADVARAGFVLRTSAEVGVPSSWLPLLAGLKGAGAAGLVVFFVRAMVAHMRARVFYNIWFPGLYLALAGASLMLSISR
jgi:hypothetical protein